MEKIKIMIVEDEGLLALKIKNDILTAGHIVTGVHASGEDAVDAAKNSPPDVALMDIHLRGEMDGITAAGALAAEYDIPSVFLTAHSDDDTVDKAMSATPYGYLLKPVVTAEMLVAVQVAVHKHRLDSEKDRLNRELRQALDEVKTLRGLIPICAACKKTRDDKGYWSQIETYISKHTDAKFSHGVCPDCMKKLYPWYKGDDEGENGEGGKN
jgi:CheY-like chemotaxis protein